MGLAIGIPHEGQLACQRGDQEILAVGIDVEDVIIARRLQDRVETAVGVFLEPPEPAEIILEAVVVARSEKPHAKLVVVEQKPAKIGLERLDADPHAIEIVAVGDIAEVIVEEGFLHADEVVETMRGLARFDEQHAPLGHIDIIEIGRQRDAVFDIGRLVGGAALEQRGADDKALRQDIAGVLAEDVDAVGPLGRLHSHGYGEGARFEHRVAYRIDDKEPVVAGDRQPRHLVRINRPVALVGVLVIGVPPAFGHEAEAFDQPPAVGDRDLVDRERLGRRRAHRALVGLRHRIGQRFGIIGTAATIDDRRVDRGGFARFGIDHRRRFGRCGLGRQFRLGSEQQSQRGERGRCHHSPSQTFWRGSSRNGAKGQLT